MHYQTFLSTDVLNVLLGAIGKLEQKNMDYQIIRKLYLDLCKRIKRDVFSHKIADGVILSQVDTSLTQPDIILSLIDSITSYDHKVMKVICDEVKSQVNKLSKHKILEGAILQQQLLTDKSEKIPVVMSCHVCDMTRNNSWHHFEHVLLAADKIVSREGTGEPVGKVYIKPASDGDDDDFVLLTDSGTRVGGLVINGQTVVDSEVLDFLAVKALLDGAFVINYNDFSVYKESTILTETYHSMDKAVSIKQEIDKWLFEHIDHFTMFMSASEFNDLFYESKYNQQAEAADAIDKIYLDHYNIIIRNLEKYNLGELTFNSVFNLVSLLRDIKQEGLEDYNFYLSNLFSTYLIMNSILPSIRCNFGVRDLADFVELSQHVNSLIPTSGLLGLTVTDRYICDNLKYMDQMLFKSPYDTKMFTSILRIDEGGVITIEKLRGN